MSTTIDLTKLAMSDDPRVVEIVRIATGLSDARAQAETAEYALRRTDEFTKWERSVQAVRAAEEQLRALIEGSAIEEAAERALQVAPLGSGELAARAQRDAAERAEEAKSADVSIVDRVSSVLASQPAKKFRAAEIAELVDITPRQAYSALLRVVKNGDAHVVKRGLFRSARKAA